VEFSARIAPNDIEAQANGVRLHEIAEGTHELACVLKQVWSKAAISQPQSLNLGAQCAERMIGIRGHTQLWQLFGTEFLQPI
jgi:hypothetical protein